MSLVMQSDGGTAIAPPRNKIRLFLQWLVSLTIFTVFVELLCLYVVLSPPVWTPIFNSVLFQTDKTDYEQEEVNRQFVQFFRCHREDVFFGALNGEKLHGSLFNLPESKKIVLFSHGNAGNLEHRIPGVVNLLACGYSVFLYDYEGYGKSTGKPNLKNVCDDAVAAFDYLVKARKHRAEDIVLLGESLGSGVTCELLGRRSCGGVIIQSGFASLLEIAREKLPWLYIYPDSMFPGPQMNNRVVLAGTHPPLLILHGRKDSLIPFKDAQSLMATSSAPKTFVELPKSGHNDIYDTDRSISLRALRDFRLSLEKVDIPSP